MSIAKEMQLLYIKSVLFIFVSICLVGLLISLFAALAIFKFLVLSIFSSKHLSSHVSNSFSSDVFTEVLLGNDWIFLVCFASKKIIGSHV